MTRSDISFTVNKLSQFMHCPKDIHWVAIKHLLRYLQETSSFALLLQRSASLHLHAYSDADWAGCHTDCKSTGGYAIFLGSNLVSWTSRKQRTVARSSTESEYKVLADTAVELTWLQTLMFELGIYLSLPPTLWCDNIGATYLCANPVFYARTKHVEIDFHFVRDKVARKDLNVQFLSTKDQLADIFTKPLASSRHKLLCSKLHVVYFPRSACGGIPG